ncbi:cytochrome d ubiquinol oxidase subunit II [Glaciimonas sp. PCH181]|uniref:cytochrome d ubiquinol oxidase subunit II n=1 Tax=Glaciimonas sp. PCH181 TaxID=2133943 RepID=UPI000D34EC5A|nr:cytochrome d ubiquinol oxidase subunit II [Glaciimonas sp. PCH181]PUA19310.1 hypothetical protein C7W93_05380 [Glaciimonas sp. PCH181]
MAIDLPIIWAIMVLFSLTMLSTTGAIARRIGVNSATPICNGNETWMIIGGVGLLMVFALAYAVVVGAFYLTLISIFLAAYFRGMPDKLYRADGIFPMYSV